MTSIGSELDMRQIFVSKQVVASLDKKQPLDLNAYKQKAQKYNIKNNAFSKIWRWKNEGKNEAK